MEITWLGQACFKLEGKDSTLVIDPFDPTTGLKLPKSLSANLLLITHEHHDHNYRQGVSGNPYEINSPGEYEVAGATVTGITAFHDKKNGEERGKITIYLMEFEGIKICHLGDLGQDLSDDEIDKLGTVDILMIPVGSTYTIDGEEAAKIVGEIEPKIVIPMHYKIPGVNTPLELEPVDKFQKKFEGKVEQEDKLKIKAANLPQELKVVVLKSQGK